MALRAALTLRHGSKAQPVRDLLPYGGGSPHVGVGFTWNNQSCWLEKKFGNGKLARLDLGAERFDGDEAEERLQALFELEKVSKGEAAGLWNALLVAQGESFAQPALQGAGRSSLQACLQQGLQGVTGTAEASAMLALVRRQLAQYQTAATGKTTGRLKQVQEESAQAQAQVAALAARKEALREDIHALEQIRRTLAESENPERRRQEEEKLLMLRQKRDQLRALADQEQLAQTQLHAAGQALQYAQAEQERRHTHRAEIARLEQALAEGQRTRSELERLAREADQALVQAQARLAAARSSTNRPVPCWLVLCCLLHWLRPGRVLRANVQRLSARRRPTQSWKKHRLACRSCAWMGLLCGVWPKPCRLCSRHRPICMRRPHALWRNWNPMLQERSG